jgi:hypothetical protein
MCQRVRKAQGLGVDNFTSTSLNAFIVSGTVTWPDILTILLIKVKVDNSNRRTVVVVDFAISQLNSPG